ncbi:hypothetical protein [Extensimonas vulgaris]|nr:hypothetical protein [Extensimonas vulgaris]TXD14084.1 hypothetical protein FUT63_10965 [Extensimonas vulgaris]
MGQEDGKKWAAAAHSQPTIPKSDRLLAACRTLGAQHAQAAGRCTDQQQRPPFFSFADASATL